MKVATTPWFSPALGDLLNLPKPNAASGCGGFGMLGVLWVPFPDLALGFGGLSRQGPHSRSRLT